MCGKFTMMMSWRELRDLSELSTTSQGSRAGETMIGTPMRMVPVIHLDAAGRRRVTPMRWGFADKHAASPLEKPKHMHARAETIDRLPTFSRAFAQARGIVLCSTFNVGQELDGGKKVVQHTITPRDGDPIALAVIFERWEDRNGGSLHTFAMVTTAPNALIATVTDRMPAIVQPKDWPLWLGETGARPEEVKAMLQPFEGDWDIAEQVPPRGPKSRQQKEDGQQTLF